MYVFLASNSLIWVVLKNGTIITPLLIYYLQLGLECTKNHRFVQYTREKCFNSFVQFAVNARKQGDENSNSSVVDETMKFLANSSYGYQIIDRSLRSVKKYWNDEKTHSAVNDKVLKRLNFITDQICEVEHVKSEIEHREPIIVGIFIFQYAKVRMLELHYNFFEKFRDIEKFCDMKYLKGIRYRLTVFYSVGGKLRRYFLPEKINECEAICSSDCTDSFTANATANSFPRTCCFAHKKHDKREPGLFKEHFRCSKMLCLCSKTYYCYNRKIYKCKFSSKGLKKRTLEHCGDGPMSKYWKVLEEAVNVTSINRGF